MTKKILGIGSALIDILVPMKDDSLLESLNLPKGSMQLIDATTSETLEKALSSHDKQMASGGSSANTIYGLAKMGVESGFLSMIGNDTLGRFFEKDLLDCSVKPILLKSNTPSGRAITFVSADGERTFATYLGASLDLSAEHLSIEMFEGWDYLYVEGYLVANRPMLDTAIDLALRAGTKIILDLASYNVVNENIDYLSSLLERTSIVFANEEEAKALTGMQPNAALQYLADRCEVAVVKIGKNGSLIQSGQDKIFVDARLSKAVDTTGAGDLYASGFLTGYLQDYPLEVCGKLGSLLSGNIVEVIGAKMDKQRWASIYQESETLLNR